MPKTIVGVSWKHCVGVSAVAAFVMVSGTPTVTLADEPQAQTEDQVTTQPVNVVDRRVAEGTGTLSLSAPSQGSTRLGLTLREIPASVEVITQQTMQERGMRGVMEAAQYATGGTVGDSPVPWAFSMRGFTGNQTRLLYDGLSLGSVNFINRPRDSWNLDRIEILKGPASVLYGEGAVAGEINLVTKRPVRELTGSEGFVSYGSFNTVRAGIGSGGRLGSDKFHYRVDLSYQNGDSYVGIQRTPFTLWNVTSAVLYDVTPRFNLALSFDIAHDRSRPYWSTPLLPSSLATQGVNGVVVANDNRTVDARMLRHTFNVTDSDMSALTTWTKLNANWQPVDWIELRNQTYYYPVKRDWMSAETYTCNAATQLVGRERSLVQHDQAVIGDRLELLVKHPIGGFIFALHYALLLPRFGEPPFGDTVVAILGLLLMLGVVAGTVLWWPRRGQWTRALTVKYPAHPRRLHFDLHKTSGVYFLVVLLAVFLSGVYLNLRAPFHTVGRLFSPAVDRYEVQSPPMPNGVTMTLGEVLREVRERFPAGRPEWVYFSRKGTGTYTVCQRDVPDISAVLTRRCIVFAQYRGDVLHVQSPEGATAGEHFIQWQWPMHSGQIFGEPGRWIVFVSGLICPLLFVTGWYLWRRKRRVPRSAV